MQSSSPQRWRPSILTRFAGFIAFTCWLFLAGWFMGRILTDRWLWSQFLFWIPTPFAIIAASIGFAFSFRKGRDSRIRTRRRLMWFLVTLALFTNFLFFEHRIFARANPHPTGIKLAHWNMTQPTDLPPMPGEVLVQKLLDINADITVMTSPGGWGWDPALIKQLGSGRNPAFIFPIVIHSRFPVIQATKLIQRNGVWVGFVQLETTEVLGRPLTIYVVDFLSRPTASRMAVADEVSGMLSHMNVPPPDLIVGDMNITRHSASLSHMFPNTADAYDQAGHGYAATFERRLPLYHIDHVLLAPWLRATRYDILDLGVARHRAQVCWFDAVPAEQK